MIRRAKAVWRGTGRAGTLTDSGVLAETPYSFKKLASRTRSTNPEELMAAAHAGYFTMALAFGLQAGGKSCKTFSGRPFKTSPTIL